MNIRLPRAAVLARLSGSDAPGVTLIEAPTGFGKSWLLRRAAAQGALRLRGEIGPLRDEPLSPRPIVIDDLQQLAEADMHRLIERLEDAPDDAQLMVAGRFLPEQLHEVARLLDGLILDTSARGGHGRGGRGCGTRARPSGGRSGRASR